MTELATLTIKVDASGAIRVVDQFGTSTQKAAMQADALAASAKRVGAAVGGAVVAGFALAIKATADMQREQAQLAAALRSTAGVSGQTIDSLNDQADALRKLTAATDAEISGAQAMLLTFTNIAGDAFPRATQATLDMAQALGTDARSAALQLGKALNDPVLGVTALGRAGVQFNKDQKAAIASFVETNQLAEAQKIILAELETQVGGSAAAYRNTLGGALKAVKESLEDLFEMGNGSLMAGFIDNVNILADAMGMFATQSALAFARSDAAIQRNNMRVGGFVMGLTGGQFGAGIAGGAAADLARSQNDIVALEKLLEEQRQGVYAGIVARTNARTNGGRGLTPPGAGSSGVSEQADAFKAILDQHYKDSAEWLANRAKDEENFREAVRQMEEQHYTDSAELLRNRTDDEIAQDEAVAAVIAQHYEDSAAALGNLTDGTDALTESARVFAEQSQLALARFASDFLKDGFKSVGSFWNSFAQLGRDAIGNIFAREFMDGIGKRISDAISGSGIGGLASLGIGGALISGFLNQRQESQHIAEAMEESARSIALFARKAGDADLTAEQRALRDILDERDRGTRTAVSAAGFGRRFSGGFDEVMAEVQRLINSGGGITTSLFGPLYEQLLALQEASEANAEAVRESIAALEQEAALRRASTLEAFRDSLALSGASTLSPVQQLAEAQRQYDAILGLAQGGDQSAIDSLPETARTLLDAARSVFASGTRYADVFGRVTADVDDIIGNLRGTPGGADPLNEVPLGFEPEEIEFAALIESNASIRSGVGEMQSAIVAEQQAQITVLQGGFTSMVTQLEVAVARLDSIDRAVRDGGPLRTPDTTKFVY